MKYYIINDEEYTDLPTWLWPDTSPITEAFFIKQGGRIEEREDPPAPEGPKHYSKLQILLYMKKHLCLLQLTKAFDKIFLRSLEILDFYDYWNAADYISTDYEDYESIVAAVKEEVWTLTLEEHVASWRAQGYTEEAINDMTASILKTFDSGWRRAVEDIKKYGEA